MRIATFNIENLDDKFDGRNPPLSVRAPLLRSALTRLDADIVCLQEVHGQELPGHTGSKPKRDLIALDTVLQGTKYASYARVTTLTSARVPYDVRNLVTLVNPAYTIVDWQQYRNTAIGSLFYRKVTADDPPDEVAREVRWERPILHVKVDIPGLGLLHVLNLHLKSRLASRIPGQQLGFAWKSAAGWAEGYFLSSMKRVGQALEARIMIDEIFDEEPDARILVCGDFNAEPGEVPVDAICGQVEDTNNAALSSRVLIPCSSGIPQSIRFTHYHHGQGNLLDHILISKPLLSMFHHSEIHNENLHDESLPFTFDIKFPESDHAGFVSEFTMAAQ